MKFHIKINEEKNLYYQAILTLHPSISKIPVHVHGLRVLDVGILVKR